MAVTIMGYNTQNRIRFLLPVTGLTHTSTGLIISTINNNEATATVYTAAANNIETITTLGTFANPTSGKCRFREVDATNHPGLYEFHIADARYAANGDRLVISVSGAAGLPSMGVHYEIDLMAHANVRAWLGITPASLSNTYVQTRVLEMANNVVTAAAIATDAIGSDELAASAASEIATAVRTELGTELGRVDAAVSSRLAGSAVPTNFSSLAITAGGAVTAGTVSDKTGYSLTATTGLGNQTANITGNLSGSVGSVTGSVGSVTSAVTVGTNNDKTGYSLTAGTGLGNQTANITGNLSGSVGSVTGNVGGSVASVLAGVTVSTNNDKTGYSLTQSFPTNFSSLAISAGGVVDADVKLWRGSQPNILQSGRVDAYAGAFVSGAIPDTESIADAVWDEATSGHTIAGTYGGRVLRATNSNVTVQVTGSNHVAADVHEFQTDVFDADAIAASAVTELQSGLATSTQLTTVEGKIDTIDNFVDTEVAAIKAKTDQLNFTIAGQVDANALTGGGGGGLDAAGVRAAVGLASANLDTQLAGIESDTNSIITSLNGVIALPQSAIVDTSSTCGFNLTAFIGEKKTHSISLFYANQDPYDFSGLTLQICIENTNKVDLEVIENDDLIVSGNVVSFTTQIANETVGQYLWSLRSLPDNLVLAQGNYAVRKAALASS